MRAIDMFLYFAALRQYHYNIPMVVIAPWR